MSPVIRFFFCIFMGMLSATRDVMPKTFVINMDEPVEQRLGELCVEYGYLVNEIYKEIHLQLPPDEADALEAYLLQWFLRNAWEPFKSEILYVANCSNTPLIGVVAYNLLYEMVSGCTSIIASTQNGTIYHGRNLDFATMHLLRNATYIAKYVNNAGDILYEGIPQFGYCGLWSGVKYGKFSISGDERFVGSLAENIMGIRDNYSPSSWLMRDILMYNNSYYDALNVLNNTKIMAPIYYILGGVKYPQGAIITRDQEHSYNLWELNGTINGTKNYLDWYIVETNYDWWEPAPSRDDRRGDAINYMNNMGQTNLNEMNLYNQVMSGDDVLNWRTIYTTIMSAGNASLCPGKTRIRFHD